MAFKKMDPKLKKLWLSALRSGEYKQGQERLARRVGHHKRKMCCLGVACDLFGPGFRKVSNHMGRGSVSIPDNIVDYEVIGGIDRTAMWGDLPGEPLHGCIDEFGTSAAGILAEMNDQPMTFLEIADWIEENL